MGKIETLREKGQNCWNQVEDGMGKGVTRGEKIAFEIKQFSISKISYRK